MIALRLVSDCSARLGTALAHLLIAVSSMARLAYCAASHFFVAADVTHRNLTCKRRN
jgi:hypothetical protein